MTTTQNTFGTATYVARGANRAGATSRRARAAQRTALPARVEPMDVEAQFQAILAAARASVLAKRA